MLDKPATTFSATFMGESTIIPADADGQGQMKTRFGTFKLLTAQGSGKVQLAIRPEHIALGGNIPAIVRDVVYQGSFKRIVAVHATQPDLEMLCKFPADVEIAVGDKVFLTIQQDKLVQLKD